MTCVDEIHEYDVGTKFLITLVDGEDALDISGALDKFIYFKKPGATTVTQTGVFETDGTDGKLYYISTEGDLDEAGIWSIQAYAELTTGKWRSNVKTFEVHANLVDPA